MKDDHKTENSIPLERDNLKTIPQFLFVHNGNLLQMDKPNEYLIRRNLENGSMSSISQGLTHRKKPVVKDPKCFRKKCKELIAISQMSK